MRKKPVFLSAWIIASMALVFCAQESRAYDSYNGGGSNCVQCHPGFVNRGALHQLHVGTGRMTSTCLLCHTQTGDDPFTNSSGAVGGVSCIGCHEPFGLRLHHKNAGAPADGTGLVCADCHSDGTPAAENVVSASTRPYYLRTDVSVDNPCQAQPAPPGEDFDGSGTGLDNDGDLDYDGNDPNCQVVVPTSTPTNTNTPVPTNTNTPVPTNTNTPVPTETPVFTDTPTEVPTDTPTPVLTDTPTEVPTDTPTPAMTNTPTKTPARVQICHVPDRKLCKAKLLTIRSDDVSKHLGHGDFFPDATGSCRLPGCDD